MPRSERTLLGRFGRRSRYVQCLGSHQNKKHDDLFVYKQGEVLTLGLSKVPCHHSLRIHTLVGTTYPRGFMTKLRQGGLSLTAVMQQTPVPAGATLTRSPQRVSGLLSWCYRQPSAGEIEFVIVHH